MSQFTIKKVLLSNFKHISANPGLTFEFRTDSRTGNLVVLDGPNGYGKTTFFDGIELLLTGEIKGFLSKLNSRGIDDISLLAHNPKEDICFRAHFISDEFKEIIVERAFKYNTGFVGELKIDGKIVTQKQFEQYMHFNIFLFKLGMYVSQKESLEFLQSKYKQRGEEVASIIDNQDIDTKLEKLQNISAGFKVHKENQLKPLEDSEKKEELLLSTLEQHLAQITKVDLTQSSYNQLFPDSEYEFDKRDFDYESTYEAVTKPLVDLRLFLTDFKAYQDICKNNDIKQVMEVKQPYYLAYFFSDSISMLNSNKQTLIMLHNMEKICHQINIRDRSNHCS